MNRDTILVVDDETLIFDSIEDTLADNYLLYHAENGAVGLQLLAEHQPILIILDLNMPVMDGFEFLKRIGVTAKGPYAVIVLSGHAVGLDIRSCYEMGITSFLRKPLFSIEQHNYRKRWMNSKRVRPPCVKRCRIC